MHKIKTLLIKIPYNKVTWQIENLSSYLIIANAVTKNYHISYSDSIPAICFLIDYKLFTLYIIYVLVSYYLIKNSKNFDLVYKIETIYAEMYITNM